MKKANVAIVGCGNISSIYLENLTCRFHNVEVTAVCDMVEEKAKAQAEKYGIPRVLTFEEILADPEIDIVLNITTPQTHYSLCKRILEAGKHTYVEKPLSLTYAEGKELVELAKEKGLMIGCAPDTFLGAGIQTCRRIIDSGVIGEIIGATAFMMCHGHESWHPDPEFYYKYGGGPMFDMGPYYITALVNLLGNVTDVHAMTKKSFEKRVITSEPHCGEIIDVEVDTHINGTMRFESGAIATLVTTFDTYKKQTGIEIYGTEGTLYVPDPNTFGGPVKLFRPEQGEIMEVPLTFSYNKNCRALGLADMAKALVTGRRFRASCDMTFHVLEIMEGFLTAGKERREVSIGSRFKKKELMTHPPVIGILED